MGHCLQAKWEGSALLGNGSQTVPKEMDECISTDSPGPLQTYTAGTLRPHRAERPDPQEGWEVFSLECDMTKRHSAGGWWR